MGQHSDVGDRQVGTRGSVARGHLGPETAFISYAREDAAFVEQLARDLEARGVSVWLDRLIQPGNRWDVEIQAAIKAAGAMLVVISEHSLCSDHVHNEYSFAIEDGDLVIPVLLQPQELPFQLRRFQWVDLGRGYDAGLADIVARLERRGASAQPFVASGVPVSPRARAQVRLWAPLAAGVLALGGGGAWLAGRTHETSPTVVKASVVGIPPTPNLASTALGERLLKDYHTLIDSRSRALSVKSDWESAAEGFEAALTMASATNRVTLESKAKFCRGRHALLEGRLVDAEQAFRASSTLHEWAPPHIELANVLTRLGRYVEGHAEARRAKALEPDFWLARVAEGSLYAAEGNMFDAVSELEAVSLLGDFPLAKANLALAFHAGRQNDARAAELAREALDRDPDLVAALQVLAEQELERGELSLARGHTQHMVDVGVFNVSAWLVHGDVLLALGENAAARAALTRALELYDQTKQGGAPLERLKVVRQALAAGTLPPPRASAGTAPRSHPAYKRKPLPPRTAARPPASSERSFPAAPASPERSYPAEEARQLDPGPAPAPAPKRPDTAYTTR